MTSFAGLFYFTRTTVVVLVLRMFSWCNVPPRTTHACIHMRFGMTIFLLPSSSLAAMVLGSTAFHYQPLFLVPIPSRVLVLLCHCDLYASDGQASPLPLLSALVAAVSGSLACPSRVRSLSQGCCH